MTKVLEQGRNRAKPDEAASFVEKFEQLEAEKLIEKMTSMARIKKIVDQQSELLDDAKGQGVPKKVIRTVVKARSYEAKSKAAMEELEDDDAADAVAIRKALGDFADLPLGAAAIERDDTTSAVVKAVNDSLSDQERESARQAPPIH
ncbi:DUF2312 domain-containing protein [Mesorhizobium sp. NBSH29]|uniref:GapR family DNA-binding domain-containing protein n=1 Tax=Mesorhizobium sp. NBSH29 TaxID=2654249 RepID=UPI0018964BC5|nr:GapR family DNA-binding domain-containing protein [Mesorhizobium sp. NBSH29]QPC87094.1 DUF2312 domain-containing protein [Mesorhizobium sp. NBSH29]